MRAYSFAIPKWREQIAFTAYIEDVAWGARIDFELLAQMVDVRLDQLAGLELAGIVALRAAHELSVGEHCAGVLSQAEQHTKLGWCERERAPSQRRLLAPG